MNVELELEAYKNLLREGFSMYTRKAFRMLPKLDKPRILDVGCGSGTPTLLLAKLSRGHVTGLDIDQRALDRLVQKIEEAGLTDRVEALNRSMLAMDFPDESFDIIWAEGSTWVIGFEKALEEWRRLVKPKRYLVAHEAVWSRPHPPEEAYSFWKKLAASGIRTVREYLDRIHACGYDVVGHFGLPEDAWWTKYYRPLEARVRELRIVYKSSPEVLEVLDREQREIALFGKYHRWYGSAFFLMQRPQRE